MTTTLHIKTDKKIRDRLEDLAKQNGITVTAVVNISIRQILNSGTILSEQLNNTVAKEDILRRFVGSRAGRTPIDPAVWQRKIRNEWERKLS